MLSAAHVPSMELVTTAEIDAPPETVWRVLADFGRYGEWNPFMTVAGRPTVGARLAVELRPPGKRTARFRPTVTVADEGRELRWLGHLGVSGLYDGEHRFVLEPVDGGRRTRLVHAERFSGIFAGLVDRWLGDSIERGFEAMNGALKERAEAEVETAETGTVETEAAETVGEETTEDATG
jgi:hypothetical protein